MIITTTRPARTVSDTNKMIDQIVIGRIEKMTNETIDELDKVISQLVKYRKFFKTILIEYPIMDIMIKNQIDELRRINNWIKKEVE